tara:strand:- start:331 stop:672 length:342 start_codon:yes stop_codon:yes gene_type:complete
MQLVPPLHIVPVPQLRQTFPSESTWSGMATPQATLDRAGHEGQHAPPRQSEPEGHMVPVPQLRQTLPPATTSGMSSPQATLLAPAQPPQHTRLAAPLVPGGLRQEVPLGQRLP